MTKRILITALFLALLVPVQARAELYFAFSAEQIQFQGEKRFFFVPFSFKGPAEQSIARRIGVLFEKLHSSRQSVYGDTYLIVKEASDGTLDAFLMMDPETSRFHDVVMGEVYLTLSNVGVDRVYNTDKDHPITDGDVKYPYFLATVPLWEALPPSKFSHALVRLGENDYMESKTFYTRLAAKDARLYGMITDLLKHKEAYVRLQTLKAAPGLAIPNELNHFIPMLKDKDRDVQHMAISILEKRISPRVLDALAKLADDDEDPETKLQAAKILVANGRSTFKIYILFEDLKSDDIEVVKATLQKLASSGDKRVIPALIRIVADPREAVREAAFAGLKQLNDLPTLEALLTNTSIEEKYRRDAAITLMRQNEASHAKAGIRYILANHGAETAKEAITTIEMRKYNDMADELVKSLDHREPEVALAAVATIGNLVLIDNIKSLSAASKRAELATAVRTTMAAMLAAQDVKIIMDLANSDDILIRELAVLALVKIAREEKDARKVEPVLKLLAERMKDKELVIKQAAVKALYEIGGEGNWERLLTMKNDPDPKIRSLVVDSALALKNEKGDKVILEKLDDEDDDVRIQAIIGARERKLKEARSKLRQFVQARNPKQKTESMKAIVALAETEQDHKEFLDIYKNALFVSNPEIQLAAIQGIQYIIDPRVVPLLQSGILLQHKDPRIRAATLIALGRSKDFNVVEDIARGFADPERIVQEAAIEGLRLMGHKKGITPLQEYIRQTVDEDLKAKAQAAIESINNKPKGLLLED